jgi:hypothetical protein
LRELYVLFLFLKHLLLKIIKTIKINIMFEKIFKIRTLLLVQNVIVF